MSPLSVRNGGGTVCRVRFAQRAPSPRGCTGGTSWSVCQSGTARSSCCRTCSPPVCCSRCRCWFRSALGHGVEVFWSRPTGHPGDDRHVHPSVRPVRHEHPRVLPPAGSVPRGKTSPFPWSRRCAANFPRNRFFVIIVFTPVSVYSDVERVPRRARTLSSLRSFPFFIKEWKRMKPSLKRTERT